MLSDRGQKIFHLLESSYSPLSAAKSVASTGAMAGKKNREGLHNVVKKKPKTVIVVRYAVKFSIFSLKGPLRAA